MQEAMVRVDDSIDFKAIFLAIWGKRKVLLVSIVLISLLFWVVTLGLYLQKPKVVTFTKQIQLTFSGLDKDSYPNGTPFSISDLIAPAILNSIYEKNNLEKFQLSRETFLGAFSVEPYAPDRALILQKYHLVAERKAITPAELSEAQENLKNELKRSAMDNVKINFTLPGSIDFPKNLAEKILQAVPETWASFEIEKRGVLKLDIPFYSEKLIDIRMLMSLDYLIMDQLLRDQIKRFQGNLEALLRFPNGNVAQDDQMGLTIPELQKAVNEMEHYDIPEVMVPIRSLAIAKRPDVVKAFFEGQIKELTLQRDGFIKSADVIKETYRTYMQQEIEKTTELDLASKNGAGLETPRSFATAIPQMGDTFLDNLMKLSRRADDVEYRQKLHTAALEHLEKAAVLEIDIERAKRSVSLINNQSSDALKNTFRKMYIERADQRIPEILERLKTYIRIAQNIAKKLSIENYGYTGLLFKDGGGVGYILEGGIALKRSVLWYVFVILATLLLIVPFIVIRQMWSSPGE